MDAHPTDAGLTAFDGVTRIASGPRAAVTDLLRRHEPRHALLVFDDDTGEQVDIDLRAEPGDAPSAPVDPPPRGVGRPRLGVVAREVTLLPRHWDWLGRQPGGASVALRRLVDEARRVNASRDVARASREAAYRFMTAIAGDLPDFDEAARALFAADRARFDSFIARWPEDIATHLRLLSRSSWSPA
jgi:hypothetical protein